jgi:hypothetical protein
MLSRRHWLRLAAVGGASLSGWLDVLAASAAADPQRRRSCILLWMSGGPSQQDTFDLKPGQKNGGPFKEGATSVPGIRISEHLPKVAEQMKRLAVIRSMHTQEGDHGRATYHLRTGYQQQGPIHYPPLGALLAHELGDPDAKLPGFVSIGPRPDANPGAFGSGFLGPEYAPLVVGGGGEGTLRVEDLATPRGVGADRSAARVDLLQGLETDFDTRHPEPGPLSHQAAYQRALRLMSPSAARAFELDEEKAALRDAYRRTPFGQSCLLARRLVERGVPFVEVALGGWDTHVRNFESVERLCGILDPAWSTLLTDLGDRGLLDTTLVVWMGEFGRTPQLNNQGGRDHFPLAWTTVLGGGSIKGGQVVGRTSSDGSAIEDRPVSVPDFMATICRALGLDPKKQNQSNVGRPIRLADAGAQPIAEVLA